MILDTSGRIHYVNLLTNSDAVLGFNALHTVLINPNFPEAVVPFDTYENIRFTGDQYGQFYREIIEATMKQDIEIVAIICDNCPAQVNGLAQAVVFFPSLGIRQVPYFNHMVNLVFTHVLSESIVTARMTILNNVIADLCTDKGVEVLG
jgi:hypothetical protein